MSTRRLLTVTCPWAISNRDCAQGESEAQPVDNVVQAAFEQAHQGLARVAFALLGLGEHAAKLLLHQSVVVFDLLLFAEVDAIIGLLAAAESTHARRRLAPLEAHFGVSQRVPFRNSFIPSRRQKRQTGEC